MPGCVNLKSKVAPADPPPYPPPPLGGLRVPLVQAPASLVVVWAEGPLLVHRTVVPAVIVSEAGEKVKSWMVTPMVPGGGGFGLVGVELPHANVPATAAIVRSRERDIFPP